MGTWTGSGLRFFDQPELAESIMRAEMYLSPDPLKAGRGLATRGAVPPKGCHPVLKLGWLEMASERWRGDRRCQEDYLIARRVDCEVAFGAKIVPWEQFPSIPPCERRMRWASIRG